MKRTFEPNPKKIIKIVLFPKVKEYHLMGVFPLETGYLEQKEKEIHFIFWARTESGETY